MSTPADGSTAAPFPNGALVAAVNASSGHHFSKRTMPSILLVARLGVAGDGHLGRNVRHLSRVRRDPTQPNLRQVHLMAAELHDKLVAAGFAVGAGDLGENITTRGVDLLALPRGTRLRFAGTAEIEVTGLRNPCSQLDRFQPGLRAAVVDRGPDAQVIRKAGVMAIVISGGTVRPGDGISLGLPPGPQRPLAVV